MKKYLLLAITLIISGCATALTSSGEKVRIITSKQAEGCERIKLVTFNQRIGPDKPGNAMKSALNEAAASGGDGLMIISTSMDWAEGASIVGESYRCN